MFRLSNLRKEHKDGWTYLRCDFEVTGMDNPFGEDSIWIAVEDENEDMLSTKVYDPFVLIPVFMGMYYKQDVHIDGNISARLYHNVTHYLMRIFENFLPQAKPVRFTVNGFDTVEKSDTRLIGTGISCGVDSLTTIYDNFVMEEKPDYRINSLFFVNCGSHGRYNDTSRNLWLDRAVMNRKAADELGLPMYLIDSNLHAYSWTLGNYPRAGYLGIYSCLIGVQKYVKRYLVASNFSYDEISEFMEQSRNYDMAEYSESYMVHLTSTESIEMVSDGCQYTRAEKTERICDWDLAKKHLNVCIHPTNHGQNCSDCSKCMRTLLALDAMGKLDNFKNVFDLGTYKKHARKWKLAFAAKEGKDAFATTVIRYLKKHNMEIPNWNEATEIMLLKEELVALRREVNHAKYANRKIVVFGETQTLEKNKHLLCSDMAVVAVVANDPETWGVRYGEFTCEKPEKIPEFDNPLVLVSIRDRWVRDGVLQQLADMGIRDVLRLSQWVELESFS